MELNNLNARAAYYLFNLLFFPFLIFPSFSNADTDIYSFEAPSMGTVFRMSIEANDESSAQTLFNESKHLLDHYENLWSPWIEGSEVWRINQGVHLTEIGLSDDTFTLIEQAQSISQLTNGAFDITFASVGHLYNYREKVRPSDKRRLDALEKINYRYISLDKSKQSISFQAQDIKIDLGGIAKGAAIGKIKQVLVKQGVTSAYFSLGGDSYVLGKKGKYPWMLGIKHPRASEKVIARIPLEDVAVSTSGDYERFYIEDGKRVHHILSPVSGLPVDEVMSVTVIGPDSWKTDALSTSVFVLGLDKGLKLIESLPDFDVIAVERNGQILASSGLMSR